MPVNDEERPYTNVQEFELWLMHERKRMVVAQNADLIRVIQSEGLLSRVAWSPVEDCIGNNRILGIDMRPHPRSACEGSLLDWEKQVIEPIAGEELFLPVDAVPGEYLRLRWNPGLT